MGSDMERDDEEEESAGEILRDRFRLSTITIAEAEGKKNGMQISEPIVACVSDLAFKYARFHKCHTERHYSCCKQTRLMVSASPNVLELQEQLAKDLELFAQHAGRKSVNMEDVVLSAHRNDHLAASLRSVSNDLKAKEPQSERKRRKNTRKEDKSNADVLYIADP